MNKDATQIDAKLIAGMKQLYKEVGRDDTKIISDLTEVNKLASLRMINNLLAIRPPADVIKDETELSNYINKSFTSDELEQATTKAYDESMQNFVDSLYANPSNA